MVNFIYCIVIILTTTMSCPNNLIINISPNYLFHFESPCIGLLISNWKTFSKNGKPVGPGGILVKRHF